jgi:hypothetical protein
LKEAIHHQLDSLHKKTSLSKLTGDELESDVNHSFMSCTKYLHYDRMITSIKNRFNSFIPHITYTSATDDRICFISFITNTKMLRYFSKKLSSSELFLFIPTIDPLKMDHSILHVLDWSLKQVSNQFNIKVEVIEQLSHPILNDINQKLPVEISIVFRPSWSVLSQEKSAKNWLNILLNNVIDSNLGISDLGKNSHWNNFFWTSSRSIEDKDYITEDIYNLVNEKYGQNGIEDKGYITENVNSLLSKNYIQNGKKNENLVESPHYSDIFDRIRNLPPYFDAMNKIPGGIYIYIYIYIYTCIYIYIYMYI